MLENPWRDIYDVVRWFGERKKIFPVDFRNIKESRIGCAETWPDEGTDDLVRVGKVLKDVGYAGRLAPDHTQKSQRDRSRRCFLIRVHPGGCFRQ